MKKIFLALSLGLAITFVGCGKTPLSNDTTSKPDGEKNKVSGIVFYDENGNGKKDSNEKGLENIILKSKDDSATTNTDGDYSINFVDDKLVIEVEKSSIGEGYTLTTNNEKQEFTSTKKAQMAIPIGYSKNNQTTASKTTSFGDALSAKEVNNNYYFEMIMDISGQPKQGLKIWAKDNSMKYENDMMITYVNAPGGKSGMYNKADNSLIITPDSTDMEDVTPFTLASQIEEDTYDSASYKGTEDIEGKKCDVFEHKLPNGHTKYYVWKDKGIILKMDTEVGDMKTSYFFKDLTVGEVTDDDFKFPDGAKETDLSNLMGMPGIK